jgi:hypothetical protein
LDKLLEHFEITEKERRNQMIWEDMNTKYKRLGDRVEALVTKARQGRLVRQDLQNQILELNNEKVKLGKEWDPSKNVRMRKAKIIIVPSFS